MREVKADNKGRLTGAKGGETYTRRVTKDGVITYTPVTPVTFDEVRDVTQKQFEVFFGCLPVQVYAADNEMIVPLQGEYAGEHVLPNGFMFSRFVFEGGKRVPGPEGESLKENVLIRILK